MERRGGKGQVKRKETPENECSALWGKCEHVVLSTNVMYSTYTAPTYWLPESLTQKMHKNLPLRSVESNAYLRHLHTATCMAMTSFTVTGDEGRRPKLLVHKLLLFSWESLGVNPLCWTWLIVQWRLRPSKFEQPDKPALMKYHAHTLTLFTEKHFISHEKCQWN